MSPPPDNPPSAPPKTLPWLWRAILLIAGTLGGSLLVAAPMILSEWDDSPSPAHMRVLIAVIVGLLLLPGVIPGFWRRPLWPALAGMIGPAVIAAVFSSFIVDEDYSYLKIGVPVMIGGGLLMTLLLPPRRSLVGWGRCHACGYDLRGTPEPRCSECGAVIDQASQLIPPPKTHRRWALVGAGGFVISSILCFWFVRFLLSLG